MELDDLQPDAGLLHVFLGQANKGARRFSAALAYHDRGMPSGLDIGFALDRRWHLLRGEAMDSKQDDLLHLARVLDASGVAWALIGGLAYQIHATEPRTTLDIDVAVASRGQIPREALRAAGFEPTGDFPDTENWRAPCGAPVQFSDAPSFAEALRTAETLEQSGVPLRVISKLELVRAKLRASVEPQSRRSKAMRDLVDVETLLEENPTLEAQLDDQDRERRDQARRRIAGNG